MITSVGTRDRAGRGGTGEGEGEKSNTNSASQVIRSFYRGRASLQRLERESMQCRPFPRQTGAATCVAEGRVVAPSFLMPQASMPQAAEPVEQLLGGSSLASPYPHVKAEKNNDNRGRPTMRFLSFPRGAFLLSPREPSQWSLCLVHCANPGVAGPSLLRPSSSAHPPYFYTRILPSPSPYACESAFLASSSFRLRASFSCLAFSMSILFWLFSAW